MRDIVLIAHNIRSAHNVGSLIRTGDGLGVQSIYLTGYTPFPKQPNDDRLPHESSKIHQQIIKTSLGAEKSVKVVHETDIQNVIKLLRQQSYQINALEQSTKSIQLSNFIPTEKLVIIVGREVEGLERDILELVDNCLEIPMLGKKESFNVTVAAAMALYHCRFK